MSQPLNIIIVERPGTLKMLAIKDFKEEELLDYILLNGTVSMSLKINVMSL
jgi:hypothetical protein